MRGALPLTLAAVTLATGIEARQPRDDRLQMNVWALARVPDSR